MVAKASAAVSYFQGGDYVELLSAQGKAPASTWKIQGKIIKSFDKAIKGNAFQMDGSSETKMQLPKAVTSTSSSLGLTQRFLIFQVLIPHTRSFSLEIGFSDFQKIRRRLVFASAFRETTMTTLHVQIPIGGNIPRDQWVNFVFDLQALTERFFPASSYRSMESICISGSCRLKRIFTMKDAPFCQSVHDNLEAQLLQFKQQRLQSKDPSSVPTAVASFSEMKDIPKQFVFSAAPSCLPIPTEYFLVSSEREDHLPASRPVPSATASSSTMAAATARTGNVVKGATPYAAAKPKSAAVGGNRGRTEVNDKAAVERPPVDVRVRSAPSSRAPDPQHQETIGRSSRVKNAESSPDKSPHEGGLSPSFGSRSRKAFGTSLIHDRPSSTWPNVVPSPSASHEDEEEEHEVTSVGRDEVTSVELDEEVTTERTNAIKQSCSSGDQRSIRDEIAARRRKQHRQDVISEIQSKLDQLTQEAQEEEEKERNAFLKHTSIPSESYSSGSVFDDRKEHQLYDPTPLLESQTSKSKGAPVDSAIDDWRDNELLRSPEPMVLRRAHAAKKPEIAFSSSIFKFDRSESSSKARDVQDATKKLTLSTKKLFDWDSLLEDSVGSIEALKKASSSSKHLDREPGPVLTRTSSRESREIQGTSSSKQLKFNEVSRKSLGNDRAYMNRSTESVSDTGMLEAKCHARHQPTMPSSYKIPENALSSESALELHAAKQTSGIKEDEDLFQCSFDFSMSPAKPGNGYQNREVLEERTSRESSPRAGSEASLDFTDDVRELEQVSKLSDSCDGENHDGDIHQESRNGIDDDDGENDDSFDFDELIVCDRDSKSQSKKLCRPGQDECFHHDEPARCITKDAKPTSSTYVEPKALPSSCGQVQMDEKKKWAREDNLRTASRVPTAASPPRKTTLLRDASESPLPPSSSRVFSSSSRRLASLLESTDWSQLPLSSVVASKERSPHSKAAVPPAEESLDKSHTATRSRKPNGATATSLELIYDPILRCYYDPVGKKYYTLAK